jgi:hypothetical protein
VPIIWLIYNFLIYFERIDEKIKETFRFCLKPNQTNWCKVGFEVVGGIGDFIVNIKTAYIESHFL